MTQEQWNAITHCDKRYDGKFFVGTTTTKRVCRPSCHKRQYNLKRTVVFETLEEALQNGYTPCSRCRPDLSGWTDTKTELARAAQNLVQERYTEKFSLPELADSLHVNKSYLLRTFKSVTGYTLLEYHNIVRCQQAQELLRRPELSISRIALEVGFATPSHFTQVFRKTTGCTPTEYRENYFNSLES